VSSSFSFIVCPYHWSNDLSLLLAPRTQVRALFSQRCLLRARRERPHASRAADERDEFARFMPDMGTALGYRRPQPQPSVHFAGNRGCTIFSGRRRAEFGLTKVRSTQAY
jgi:hypothetical protein